MPTFAEDLHLGHKVPLIETDDLHDGLVTTEKLSDGAVTGDKLADGVVTGDKLADKSIEGRSIADKVIESRHLSDDLEIDTEHIADDAITEGKIAEGAVTAGKIGEDAVKARNIAEGAVVEGNIAPNAVENRNLTDGCVTEGNLAPGAVTSDKLASEVISQLETITDPEPTPNSVKPAQSGGVFKKLAELGQFTFERGGINSSGANMSNAYRARSTYFKVPVGSIISVADTVGGFPCTITINEYANYGDTVNVKPASAWVKTYKTTTAEWVRIAFKFDDVTTHNITDSDLPLISESVTYILPDEYKINRLEESMSSVQESVSKLEQSAFSNLWINSDFEQGGYDSDGSKTGTYARIRTKDRTSVKAGDRLFLYLGASQYATIGVFMGDAYTSTLYTKSTVLTFDTDCEIVVTIRWEDANQAISPTMNECLFLYNQAADYANKVNKDIEGKQEKTSLQLTKLDFIAGNIDANGNYIAGSGKRIRTIDKISVNKGAVVVIEPPIDQMVRLGCYVTDGDTTTYSVLLDKVSERTLYKIEQDCEIAFVVTTNPDLGRITVNDYNCNIAISWSIEMKELLNINNDGTQHQGVIARNADKNNMLVAMSHNGEYLQICLASDVHNDKERYKNAVLATEGFSTIKCLLALGDMVYDNMYARTNANFIYELTKNMNNPFLMVLGNHDVGNSAYIPYTVNQQQSYDIFMQPFHDRGILNNEENLPGTSYWYKDFLDYKVRLIGLNCYDEDIQFDETNWRPISYSASYDMIQKNTTYSAGDKVNVQNFTDYSFEAVQPITTDALGATTTKGPSYKCKRGTFVIGETQANWLADKLATVPEGFGVVIAMHGTFSSKCHNNSSFKFADDAGGNRWANPGSHYMMETDFLAELVEAYKNKAAYSKDIVMNGTAAYMNTQGGGTYAYHIEKDFTASKGSFLCWLGGHWHADLIWQHDNYNQYQIAPTWTNQRDWTDYQATDIVVSQENDVSNDCLTNVSFNVEEGKVGLVKIGQNITLFDKKRDVEVIGINENHPNTEYYGKKLVLNELSKEKQYCNSKEISSMMWVNAETPNSVLSNWLVDLQSSCIFGNYIFNWLDHGNCMVMNFESGEIIGKFDGVTDTSWHNNNAQFSNIFYDPNDEFPLCLVSDGHLRESGAMCAYVRIVRNGNNFTFTTIKEFFCEFEKGKYYGSFVADWVTNKLYMYCYDKDLMVSNDFNVIYILEYKLPEIGDGSRSVLTDNDIVNKASYPMYRPYTQGGTAVNGKVILALRSVKLPTIVYPNSEEYATDYDYRNAGKMIMVFNQETLDLETFIQVPGGREMEGLCYYDGKLYLTERSGGWNNSQHTTPSSAQIYTLFSYEF